MNISLPTSDIFTEDYIELKNVNDNLPNSWVKINKDSEYNKEKFKNIKIQKHYQKSDDQKFNLTWDIIYSIKLMVPKVQWKTQKQEIISYVMENGIGVNINDHNDLANWRMNAYSFAGIN